MEGATIESLAGQLTSGVMPFIAVGLTFIFILMAKDWLTSIAKGLRFRYDPTFNEGDIVFLDGERAIIVKLGMLKTVFGVTKDDGTYCWRYVPNTRIEHLKLEKIINLDNMKLPKIPDGKVLRPEDADK